MDDTTIERLVYAWQERINRDKFKLVWRDGQYKVSKPNLDTQEVVPLATVLEMLESFNLKGEFDAQEKGTYNGPCNRTACQKPGAKWYNQSTRKYYCGDCAEVLNRVNMTEALVMFKGPLCILHPTQAGI